MKLEKSVLQSIRNNIASISLLRVSDSHYEVTHSINGYFKTKDFSRLESALEYFSKSAELFNNKKGSGKNE